MCGGRAVVVSVCAEIIGVIFAHVSLRSLQDVRVGGAASQGMHFHVQPA